MNDYKRPGVPDDVYLVWPIGEQAMAWERAQWAIFVAWNDRYESGNAGTDSHPRHGGVDARFDALPRCSRPTTRYRPTPTG